MVRRHKSANGQGSILKRKDGRWMGAVILAGGERAYVYGRTEREVVDKLVGARLRGPRPLAKGPMSMSVGMLLDLWLETLPTSGRRPRTINSYRFNVETRIRPFLGDTPLDDLTPELIDAWLADLRGSRVRAWRQDPGLLLQQVEAREIARKEREAAARKGAGSRKARRIAGGGGTPQQSGPSMEPLAATTLIQAYRCLRVALSFAVRRRFVAANTAMQRPESLPSRPPQPDISRLEPLELVRFERANSTQRCTPLFMFLAYSGLRSGEALALTWDDVDLKRGQVTVDKSVYRGRPGLTKTRRSRRTVPLLLPACEALQTRLRAREHEAPQPGRRSLGTSLVFPNASGGYQDAGTLSRLFAASLRRVFGERVRTARGYTWVNWPRLSPHSLRHTYASTMISLAVPIAVVSDLLGHASIQLTVDTYSSLLTETTSKYVTALNESGYFERLGSAGEAEE